MKEVSFLDKEFYRALLVGVDPNHTLDTEVCFSFFPYHFILI